MVSIPLLTIGFFGGIYHVLLRFAIDYEEPGVSFLTAWGAGSLFEVGDVIDLGARGRVRIVRIQGDLFEVRSL